MDSKSYGQQGTLLAASGQTSTARVMLESGALLGGITGGYCSQLARTIRLGLRFCQRADRPFPAGIDPHDALLWYAEAMRRGGTDPQMVREAASFAVAWWNEAVDLDWHRKLLELGAPPARLWATTIAAAAVADQPEIGQYALAAMRAAVPSDARIKGLESLVTIGINEATLKQLDDEVLADLLLACDEQGMIELLATVATTILQRNPADARARETYAAALEEALLGSPGAPDLGAFHPTGAGRALLAMAAAMSDDPDGRWLRRRTFAALKGGDSPEKILGDLGGGLGLGEMPDAWLFALADGYLTRSQRYQPGRHVVDFGIARGRLGDPRLSRLHAFMTFLQGERMHAWASLLDARRIDPAPVQLNEASRLRDAWFPDANLFGDCFDADMTTPIGEAIGHLLHADYEQAMEVAVDGLAAAHGRALPEIELHLVLGECHARPGRTSPRSLKNYRRALERLASWRGTLEQPGDRPGAERLARSIAASALDVAAIAGLAGEALWFAQEVKLQGLVDQFDGAGAIPPEFAERYAQHLAARFQPDGAPASLFGALAAVGPNPEGEGDFDEPWNVDIEAELHQHVIAGRQQGMTAIAYGVEPATPDALRSRLAEGDVFIEYLLAPNAVYAIVATPDEFDVIRTPLDTSLTATCRDAWYCCAIPPDDPAAWSVEQDARSLRALYSALITPVEPWLEGAQRLIVAPSGGLNRIPFAALHDGQHWLVERYEIVQVPTAAVFVNLEVGRGPWQREAAAVVNPEGSWPTGAHTSLTALCPNSQVIEGQPISTDDALGLLGAAAVVHVSSPGYIDPDFPSCSPVVVGSGPADGAGLLQPCAVLATNAMPVLLVLDGTTSEPARAGTDHEACGPIAGFLASGISNVVATAWQSDPGATGELFRAFYDAFRDLSVPAAMAEAQRQLLGRPDTAHPYFWAAPIACGEGSASIGALREHGLI